MPPESLDNLASKDISLLLSWRTGSNTVPEPLPPSIVTEITLLISKSWGSTWISTTSPVITGLIYAVVLLAPDPDNWIFGGLITS